jgi:nucleotide-binding universal stress UspA family protein
LADRNQAHLVGLYVVPAAIYGSTTAIGARLAGSGRKAFREEAERIRQAFDTATKGRPIVAEWRLLEPSADHPGVAEAVIEQARTADIVVAAQTDDNWEYSLLLDCPDRLAMESGRPAIIVPHAGRFPRVGTRVVVAWNGKREATRAVFDAMPLLRQAEAVRILWVNPDGSANALGRSPGEDLAATLARQGVKCELASSVATEIDVADDLLSRVSDYGADLLVMGIYGHSRLREFVFGGATRKVLRHMTVPVLMSHLATNIRAGSAQSAQRLRARSPARFLVHA